MIKADSSWQDIVQKAYNSLDDDYREFLEKNSGYFPDFDNFLNAFKTLSFDKTKYILFGQDPYPRKESATGYAFIDGKVSSIFGTNGLSKEVNRATSLRNFIKMLLVADGSLSLDDTSKEAIAKVDKSKYINTIIELKNNFEQNGVLLLNISLVFTSKKDTSLHVKNFNPFIRSLLENIKEYDIKLILFGNIAQTLKKKVAATKEFKIFETLHPYNTGFIKDKKVLEFFEPMELLSPHQ